MHRYIYLKIGEEVKSKLKRFRENVLVEKGCSVSEIFGTDLSSSDNAEVVIF